MDYIKLPLDFSAALQGKLSGCSNEESIAQHLMMLIVSHRGEVESAYNYGSNIWELEYDHSSTIEEWEINVKASLVDSITIHEKRLKDIKVSVELTEVDDDIKDKHPNARRCAQIGVRGTMVSNNKSFYFNTRIYISPISQ